jgi:hypothetical protein
MDKDAIEYPVDINPFGLDEGRAEEWSLDEASAYLKWRVENLESRTDVLLNVARTDLSLESVELLTRLGSRVREILRLPDFSGPYTGPPATVMVKGHTLELSRTMRLSPKGVSIGRDMGLLMARLLLRDFAGWLTWTIPNQIRRRNGENYYEHGYNLPALVGFPTGVADGYKFVPTLMWGKATNVTRGVEPPTIWASVYSYHADIFVFRNGKEYVPRRSSRPRSTLRSV